MGERGGGVVRSTTPRDGDDRVDPTGIIFPIVVFIIISIAIWIWGAPWRWGCSVDALTTTTTTSAGVAS